MKSPLALRLAGLLVTLGATSLALRSHEARAAWPPASGANMQESSNWPNDPGYSSQWNYWSYLPQQKPGTNAYIDADQKLGASGMSVDVGWTYTVGRREVKVFITDSGIEWEEPDLVNKVGLNAAELAGTKRPQTAAGAACGGTADLAGYDCDGDGRFTVADYALDPRVSPTVKGDACFTDGDRTQKGPDRIKGDVNHNCILDPGDLIEMFSDGVDDDGNGYVDDIAGWDFFKNDNNPYDDTRYGHGTGEAKDSNAQGNNGVESVGVCPECTVIPLRVGNSFIADADDFAKAVVYATDNGAKVLQEALGTIDQTPFARAAIDYAYAHNVTVIASMADENSRHHNSPGTANHTLPVHAIEYDGPDYDSSTTFLNFCPCTNYGGQLGLSVSGRSCSSEATGRSSGIAGLLYSLDLSQPQPLGLTAEEVMQLMKMTADVVDVPESRSTNPDIASLFYESRPGFSQRFGYGRPNVVHAMQAIQSGMIPPEVEILQPAWFDVLYADRSNGPVPIMGRVTAKRATSYDFQVEWAAGVEPDDSAFQVLGSPLTNIPAGTTSGGSQPLAMLDPTAIDTTHTPDPDSPHHENDRTITLRVQAVAHYAGSQDVRGEARRTIAIVNEKNGLDTDLLPGFPIKLDGSLEGGPKLADINGDGVRDIVIAATSGEVHVFSVAGGAPVELPGFPYKTSVLDGLNPSVQVPGVPSYLGAPAYKAGANGGIDLSIAREAIIGPPAIADLNGDGKPEIVVTTWTGSVHVVDSTGQAVAGWPQRLPLVPSCPLDPSKPQPTVCMDTFHNWARGVGWSPALADLDRDGKPEIILAAFDGNVYVFHGDGTPLAGWPVLVHAPTAQRYNRIMTTPTVADFNGDGIPDLSTGSNESVGGGDQTGPVFIIDGRGNAASVNGAPPYLKDWPVILTAAHVFPVVAEGVDSAQATADFNGDGKPDLLVEANASPPYIFPSDPGLQQGFNDPPNKLPIVQNADGTTSQGVQATSIFGQYSQANTPDTMIPVLSQSSIGDLDQDGVPDVLMSGGSLSLLEMMAGGSVKTGQHLLGMWSGKTGAMFPGSPVVLEDYTFFMSPAVADLNGDGYPEAIIGTGGYFVHATDACGRELANWPKFTDGWLTGTPAVGDVNGDHKLEVVAGTREGYLFAWTTPGSDKGVIQWESFHHDNANTGNYSTPLDQGVLSSGAPTLACPAPGSNQGGGYAAGGGCAASGNMQAPWWISGMALVGAAGVLARRRRKGSTST